jgi:glycosyltransferase involved in cell wall biosynthesis
VIALPKQLGPKSVFFIRSDKKKNANSVVVYARSGKHKGLSIALDVASYLRDDFKFKFVVAEDGLKAELERLGYECLKSFDAVELRDFVGESSFLFLPSSYEGLSLPMLEGLWQGTRVVTLSEGFPEWLAERCREVVFLENSDLKNIARSFHDLHGESKMSVEKIQADFFTLEEYSQFAADFIARS